jgi:hypothetical protein
MTVSPRGRQLQGSELMIFDSNGNNIYSAKLYREIISNPADMDTESYSFDVHSLPSGTYFATLLLDGTKIGGWGNFVITK